MTNSILQFVGVNNLVSTFIVTKSKKCVCKQSTADFKMA